jgi:hypothetical protein
MNNPTMSSSVGAASGKTGQPKNMVAALPTGGPRNEAAKSGYPLPLSRWTISPKPPLSLSGQSILRREARFTKNTAFVST